MEEEYRVTLPERRSGRLGHEREEALIVEALNLFMIPQQVEMQMILPDNEEERTLLALIGHEPRHVDELIRESGLPTMTVSSTLAMMELKGMIRQVAGMQFVLAR